ncbi:hypothetical protein AAUPMC_10807, partial [Pasteurella multocida subsp. multocida str. Anand1_cattle]
LQPASSFRDFQRQQAIWNAKFYGERKVHDDQGNPLDLSTLSDWEKYKLFYVGLLCREVVVIIGARKLMFLIRT